MFNRHFYYNPVFDSLKRKKPVTTGFFGILIYSKM